MRREQNFMIRLIERALTTYNNRKTDFQTRRNKKKQFINVRKKLIINVTFPVPCFYCNRSINSTLEHTYDHKTPICRGGTNDTNNLVSSCKRCNNRKGHKTAEEFLNKPLP